MSENLLFNILLLPLFYYYMYKKKWHDMESHIRMNITYFLYVEFHGDINLYAFNKTYI